MHLRRLGIGMWVSALLVEIAGAPALCQTGALQGTVRTSGGQLAGEDEVRACIEGPTLYAPDMAYGRIYWDGIYRIPEGSATHVSAGNMIAGTYAVGMSDEYEWRGRNYSFVQVKSAKTNTCNINIPGTYEVRSQNGSTSDSTEIGQTFVSKGGCIQRITVWDLSQPCTLTIHEGGPGGEQIGPSMDLTAGGGSTARYLYGDGGVQTVAGQTYYVKLFHSGGGLHTYKNSGDPYPNGQAYYGGVAQTGVDLSMTIFEDCDGQATMYCVPHNISSTDGFYANEIGQTFKARGANILSVCLRLSTGGGNKNATLSIVDGGPGGTQIGPTKAVFVKDYGGTGQKVTACWLPGEVPVTVGNTYYVKLECSQGIYAFCSYSDDVYPDGTAYMNGVVHRGDLFGTIMGEVTLGSSTCTIHGTVRDNLGSPVVGATVSADNCGYTTTSGQGGSYSLTVTADAYNLTCAATCHVTQYANSYIAQAGASQTLDWILPGVGTLNGYVRDIYGNPLVGAGVLTSPGGYSTTTRSSPAGYYLINGVLIGSYDITASQVPYQSQTIAGVPVNTCTNTTRDFALAPQSALANPGFESGLTNWTNYGNGLLSQTGTGPGGITPHGGARCAYNSSSGANPKIGGAYQQVWAPVASPFTASVYAACCGQGGGAAHTWSRIGIDPTGGVSASSGNVQWSAWYKSPAEVTWQWTQLYKTVTATGNILTVFLDYWQEQPGYALQVNAFDDVQVTGASTIALATARQQPDGSYVCFAPAIITAKFTGSPNYLYVEQPDRLAGLKVTGSTSCVVGDSVKIGGTMQTSSGERSVSSSVIDLVTAAYGCPGALGMANRAVGGGPNGLVPGITGMNGPNNVGLLVRAWGHVTPIDSTSFYIADGSSGSLKIAVPSGTALPPADAYASVTGISSTVDLGGGVIGRLVRARAGGILW